MFAPCLHNSFIHSASLNFENDIQPLCTFIAHLSVVRGTRQLNLVRGHLEVREYVVNDGVLVQVQVHHLVLGNWFELGERLISTTSGIPFRS